MEFLKLLLKLPRLFESIELLENLDPCEFFLLVLLNLLWEDYSMITFIQLV
jgi:hypothetical protein